MNLPSVIQCNVPEAAAVLVVANMFPALLQTVTCLIGSM